MAGSQPYATFANLETDIHETIVLCDPPKLSATEKIYDVKLNEQVQIVPYIDVGTRIYNDEIPLGPVTYESKDINIVSVDEEGIAIGNAYGMTEVTILETDKNLSKKVIVQVKKSFIEKIEEGNNFTVILKDDGTVWGWGSNEYGQLGNHKTENTSEPVQALDVNGTPLTGIKDIAAGSYNLTVLKEDGTVWTYGKNKYFKPAESDTTEEADEEYHLIPVQVMINEDIPLTNIQAIEYASGDTTTG